MNKIIFGRNPVLEYIKNIRTNSGRIILYVSDTGHGKIIDDITAAAKEKKILIEFCSKEKLWEFEPSSRHQGVVLDIGQLDETYSISDNKNISALLKEISWKNGVLVMLDQLTDPQNVGSIIRSAEALGADGIILTKHHSAGITPAVVKSSAGATAHLPVHTVTNAANFIDNAKEAGFHIIGASEKGDEGIDKLREQKPAVIIIGNEGSGMRRLTFEKCDHIVRIPLKGKISSLNASVAAGIIIYEILKD